MEKLKSLVNDTASDIGRAKFFVRCFESLVADGGGDVVNDSLHILDVLRDIIEKIDGDNDRLCQAIYEKGEVA